MDFLLVLSRGVDRITTVIGKSCSWLVLVAVLVSAGNAIIRYAFNMSSNGWLELQWYLFAAVFLLCAAYTLLNNEHIRIDVVSSRLSQRSRHVIDLVGHVFFLLPLCLLILYEGWPYFFLSWAGNEQSSNSGGLVRWPAKALILVGFALLLAQCLSELVKRIAVMQGRIPDPYVKPSAH
jgi:TRAP-type mannitol/chloroaromatic compound transport system permease small subunit